MDDSCEFVGVFLWFFSDSGYWTRIEGTTIFVNGVLRDRFLETRPWYWIGMGEPVRMGGRFSPSLVWCSESGFWIVPLKGNVGLFFMESRILLF